MRSALAKLVGIAAVGLWSGTAAAITVDGVGNDAGYGIAFDVSFTVDGDTVDGGKLFLGTGAASDGSGKTNAFLYFAMPREFVDNSYGDKDGEDNSIGWGNKTHEFKSLVGSDKLQVQFFEDAAAKADDDTILDITVDYLAQVEDDDKNVQSYQTGGIQGNGDLGGGLELKKSEGGVDVGSAASVISVGTSLDFNVNASQTAANLGINAITDLGGTKGLSPDFDENIVDPDPNNPPSLADLQYADALSNPQTADWEFDVAYELEIDGDLFKDANGQVVFTLDNVLIADAHVSPSKLGGSPTLTFTPGDPPDGPDPDVASEPMSALLLMSGLAGLGWARRRRRAV